MPYATCANPFLRRRPRMPKPTSGDVSGEYGEIICFHHALKTETARPHRPRRQFNSSLRSQARPNTDRPPALQAR
jgi:hypothetical protein